jgi:hypothetical protein
MIPIAHDQRGGAFLIDAHDHARSRVDIAKGEAGFIGNAEREPGNVTSSFTSREGCPDDEDAKAARTRPEESTNRNSAWESGTLALLCRDRHRPQPPPMISGTRQGWTSNDTATFTVHPPSIRWRVKGTGDGPFH